MSVLTTVELKQLAGNKNGETGGDWSNTLMKPVYIEDGDEISLSKVFIDSTSQNSNNIFVKNDLSMEFNCMIYNQNNTADGKTYAPGTAVDGNKYLQCSKTTHTPGAGSPYEEVLTVGFLEHKHNNPTNIWGGFTARYSYINTNNDTAYWHTTIQAYTPSISNPTAITVPINVIAKKNTFTLISPSILDMYTKYTTDYSAPTKGAITAGDIYSPIITKKTIVLPAGNYDPLYVAKFITNSLTANNRNVSNPSTAFIPISNEYLFSSAVLPANRYFINCETPGLSFTYTPIVPGNPGMWIGSSQLALQYDLQNHFYFSDLHLPIYGPNGQKICKFLPTISSEFLPISSSGGILINSIRCFDIERDHIPFFENTLGFDMGAISPKIKVTDTIVNGSASTVPILTLIDGTNFTQGRISLDMGIQKNAYSPMCPNTAALVNSIQDQTTPIYSQSISGDAKATNTGYYQIEINSVFKNEFIGDQIQRNNISGIVSRYFTQNSYTSGSADSSIPYIHRGQPTQLKGFRVRILDSNGKLAEDLNDDNTVILRVTKPMKKETK